MNTHLLQTRLEDYAAAAPYPLHMPGHKRRVDPAPGLPAAWDVTEVPGVDDLHEAQGILADAMNRAAALWGAQRSWFLVNGSTGGILAAIRAAALTRPGRPIVCARNCHKSVYHAIELNALAVEWMTPPVDPAFGVYGSVTPAQAAAALDRCPGAAALVLTSPTYEGVLSDVAALAALCHDRDVPRIVDEAHGAHYLPLAQPFGWQGGAVAAGADLVIQSPHKTLPSLTQTALLHQNGGRIPAAAVERQLDVFETSSPSYPLLASLDGSAGLLAAHGTQWCAAWRERTRLPPRAPAAAPPGTGSGRVSHRRGGAPPRRDAAAGAGRRARCRRVSLGLSARGAPHRPRREDSRRVCRRSGRPGILRHPPAPYRCHPPRPDFGSGLTDQRTKRIAPPQFLSTPAL